MTQMFAFGSACKGERMGCGQGCRGVGRQLRRAGGLKAESLFWEAAEPLEPAGHSGARS